MPLISPLLGNYFWYFERMPAFQPSARHPPSSPPRRHRTSRLKNLQTPYFFQLEHQRHFFSSVRCSDRLHNSIGHRPWPEPFQFGWIAIYIVITGQTWNGRGAGSSYLLPDQKIGGPQSEISVFLVNWLRRRRRRRRRRRGICSVCSMHNKGIGHQTDGITSESTKKLHGFWYSPSPDHFSIKYTVRYKMFFKKPSSLQCCSPLLFPRRPPCCSCSWTSLAGARSRRRWRTWRGWRGGPWRDGSRGRHQEEDDTLYEKYTYGGQFSRRKRNKKSKHVRISPIVCPVVAARV